MSNDLTNLLEPIDPDARMDAYYYGFEPTGVGIVDRILSAVAYAGKAYHNTSDWADNDPGDWPYLLPDGGDSAEQAIQNAAIAAAAAIRAAVGGEAAA